MTISIDTGFAEMRLDKVVGLSGPDQQASCFVVLAGAAGAEPLVIEIGPSEAMSLSASMTGLAWPRPMSADFAARLLQALGGRLRAVRIDRLVEAYGGPAYGATVEVDGPGGTRLIDARPSDALNLVARTPAPILVAAQVMHDAAARMAGDAPGARLLRDALDAEPMTVRQQPGQP